MEFIENKLTYEGYVALRHSVSWEIYSEEQVRKSIGNSLYVVTATENNQTIAMGRLVGDGMYYMIVDVIVEPKHQSRGIGSQIIDKLIHYVEKEIPDGGRASIQLIAEKGKEEFYIKKGFKVIPHEFCGSGMRKVIRKH